VTRGIYKFEIYSRMTLRGRRHYFRMVAPNGEIILQSQSYRARNSCIGTVNLIQSKADQAIVVAVDA